MTRDENDYAKKNTEDMTLEDRKREIGDAIDEVDKASTTEAPGLIGAPTWRMIVSLLLDHVQQMIEQAIAKRGK